jgi:hypothetical protein
VPALLLIKVLSNGVDTPQQWRRGEIVGIYPTDQVFGAEMDTNVFYRFTVTDKTPLEMSNFAESYNRDLEFTLINPGPPRRYEVKNLKANTLGTGMWTLEAVDRIKLAWETGLDGHPLADITTIGFPNTGVNGLGNIWDMSGVFSVGEGQAFQETVYEAGLNVLDRQRQWFVDEQGMTAIGNAGGVQSGTSQQIGQSLVDGTLL